MYITENQRKLQRKEAQQRLEFLVSNGLNPDMLRQFKSLGRIYVNEIIINDWASRNGKAHNKFPRTYVFSDMVEGVTEKMLDTKLKIENDGYLVYLITREKRDSINKENSIDRLNYFLIDNVDSKFVYNAQNIQFRNGLAKVYSQDLLTGKLELNYIKYKVRMEQVIVEEN